MSYKRILKDYQERKRAKKDWKQKHKKIIDPGKKEEEQPTKTILEKKIIMNRIAPNTNLAFGVSEERVAEILRKMIAVANLYPKYSTIAEVLLNCSDRFTEMERIYGIFVLGRVQGQSSLLRKIKKKMRFDSATMPLEARLLARMSKQIIVEDKLLKQIFEGGKGG